MKPKVKYKVIGLLLLMVWFQCACFGQCKISSPKILCMGDVGYFTISLPSGSTLISADWTFGDGYTGTGQSPGHLFSKSGKFTVKCKLKLSGGAASCEDSIILNVLNLPMADFDYSQIDTCFNKNKICITNKSKAANSKQPITKNLMIWGDGSITNIQFSPCYTYKQKAEYKLSLEVTDSMGCKSIKSDTIQIVPGLDAKFTSDIYKTCGKTIICFTNTTDTVLNGTNKYIWQFNNSSKNTTNYKPQCLTYYKKELLNVKYLVSNGNGCKDSFSYKYAIEVDTPITYIMKLSDTSWCYSQKSKFEMRISPPIGNKFLWYMNGKPFGTQKALNEIIPKNDGYLPGRYHLKCEVINGSCSTLIDTFISIKGPMAKIKIFSQYQCDADQKVFFIDSSKVSSFAKSSRMWVLKDSLGDSCISKRAQNINLYKNCNYSTDNYHKHKYKDAKSKNLIEFYVYDSLTRCADSIKTNVNLKACAFEKKDTICQGNYYLKGFSGDKAPIKFSIDSGKTWIYFPGNIDLKYLGQYNVMLMYEEGKNRIRDFGKDSFQILKDSIYYKLVFLKDQLLIKPNPNTQFSYTISKDCGFKDVVVKLKSPQLYANETLVFYWGDGKSDTIRPKANYLFDSIIHRYKASKLFISMSVSRKFKDGCFSQSTLPVEYGFEMFFKVKGGPCLRNNICLEASVYDLKEGKNWSNSNNLGKIELITGEKSYINDFTNPCFQYKNPGFKSITFLATSKDEYKDSLSYNLIVNDLRAGITSDSKKFGCGEIKQLFDSSVLLGFSNDKISSYLWDFGTRTFAVTQKNPYYAFTKFGNYEVIHIVKSVLGCTDSIKYMVTVEGPQPQFDIISDTLGCEPLVVKFKNNSKHCTQYYWRFGDANQSTVLDTSKGEITFTYASPGKFKIVLTGIDSFFSSATQTTYFCKTDFPEWPIERTVTVLPLLKVAFDSPDTTCLGQVIDIKNLSNTRVNLMHWDMGDGSQIQSPNNPVFNYSYKKSGTYKIKVKPIYSGRACADSAEKTIVAKGVLANFEFTPYCESPLFKFNNTSDPLSSKTQYHWDFGQPNLSNNQSKMENPEHDYQFNRGDFVVCLTLKDEFGCADSVCKTLSNDYKTKLFIPNVFTPGSIDSKNDEFDIEIEGEEMYNLSILNRWGQLVYQSDKDCERGDGNNWNGKFQNKGAICPSGTYFYIFDYKNCYGDTENKQTSGAITLIR
jgi:gliding motility-associated-like protein